MQLNSPTKVRLLLEKRGIAPSKVLGQNFLIDGNIREVILKAAKLTKEDHVLEIGPGLGMLTEGLLEQAGSVTAVEKDRALVGHLSVDFANAIEQGRLTLLHGDALALNLSERIAQGAGKVLSNLPYSVGNRILVDLAQGEPAPDGITIMVQRDVAERIVAGPGTKEYGILSLLVQLRYKTRIVKHVSPSCFVPAPRVWSSVIQLDRDDRLYDTLRDKKAFSRIVKHCFSQRRKQLQSTLSRLTGYGTLDKPTVLELLDSLGIVGSSRPEVVPIARWVELCNRLSES